jgi:hypothetical protein
MAALHAINAAAEGRGGAVYPGAADRLLRIAETATDVGLRGGALLGLTRMPNKEQALQNLRRVAISQNKAAQATLQLLRGSMGPPGIAMLKELYAQGLVTEPMAHELLNVYAKEWKR